MAVQKFPLCLPRKGTLSAGVPQRSTVRSDTNLLGKGLDARCFIFFHIEDGVEIRDLQQVMYFLG